MNPNSLILDLSDYIQYDYNGVPYIQKIGTGTGIGQIQQIQKQINQVPSQQIVQGPFSTGLGQGILNSRLHQYEKPLELFNYIKKELRMTQSFFSKSKFTGTKEVIIDEAMKEIILYVINMSDAEYVSLSFNKLEKLIPYFIGRITTKYESI